MSDSQVAIIGMDCLFPGAPSLDAFWDNILGGVDAITDAPPARWDPLYYDPQSRSADRLYCKRGGFIDDYADFDALAFGIVPVEAQSIEPDQLLALRVANSALADAGYAQSPFPRERTGVILGRGNYMSVGLARRNERLRTAEQLGACLRTLVPSLGPAEAERVKSAFQAQFEANEGGAAIGLVPNLTASRIANRLDLQGPAYTIDAACASSLVAVDHACTELRQQSADLMLAGGVHLCHDVTFWSVFCQLGALSRTEQIRPFHSEADGLLIGEGVGVVVLKRLADAERDGDRIYAVICGTGVASDGRDVSLMNPRSAGQVLALERAWRQAGIPPSSVGLIEAHGAGTPVGDAAELATLAHFFGPLPDGEAQAGLGSVKSMIGHAMPAAGAAGLIKAALAVYHGVLPPTLHCEKPNPALTATRFRLVQSTERWNSGSLPRRAGVNAFGFGGINAHVVLESRESRARRSVPLEPSEEGSAMWTYAAENASALLEALQQPSPPRDGTGPCRLALLHPTRERLARAASIVSRGVPWAGHEEIWFATQGLSLSGGKLAFLFPGLDAAFEPRLEDLGRRFPSSPPSHTSAENPGVTSLAVIAVNRFVHRVLIELGVRPDLAAGHSIGEWSAMIAAGMIPESAVDEFVAGFQAASLNLPKLVYLVAGCGVREAEGALDGLSDVFVSHDNCPHQVILCGAEGSVEIARTRLHAAGILCQALRFRSGFHSPLLDEYLEPFRITQERFPLQSPKIPLWSATTCAPYPVDHPAIRRVMLDHLVRPVRFRELIEALYEDGARIFLQVGSGSLPGFVDDTLRHRRHLAMTLNSPRRSGLAQLRRVAAALFVEGIEVQRKKLDGEPALRVRPDSKPLKLSLGLPLVKLDSPAPPEPADPVRAAFDANLRRLATAEAEVRSAWAQARSPRLSMDPPQTFSQRKVLSVETVPELLDHCLFPQGARCRSLLERFPVVPLTTSIVLLMDAGRQVAAGRTPVAVLDVRSQRWLAVAPPAEVQITARRNGSDRVATAISDYVDGTVLFADGFSQAPVPSFPPLSEERPAFVTADRLYRDGWMFHGPAFRGIVELGPLGRNGIDGIIETGAAPGALLDNAGQLLGYWVMAGGNVDSLAMPIGIERIDFYGPEPSVGTRVVCKVRIRELTPMAVCADMELLVNGRLWAKVKEWEDRRLQTNDRLWPVLRDPEKQLLAVVQPDGWACFHDIYRQSASRDFLARRFLSESEREAYLAVPPSLQRVWLAGRVAAKDAVRAWMWNHGAGPLYPAEIEILSEATGQARVRGPQGADLRIAISHRDDLAFAKVAEGSSPAVRSEILAASDHTARSFANLAGGWLAPGRQQE